LRRKGLIAGIIFLLWIGCLPPVVKEPPPSEMDFFEKTELPQPPIDDLDKKSLQMAVENSLAYLDPKQSSNQSLLPPLEGDGKNISLAEKTYRSLVVFHKFLLSSKSEEEFQEKIQENFNFYEITPKRQDEKILLTGYYEPILEGSMVPEGEYRYPIYRLPDDLVTLPSGGGLDEFPIKKRIGRMVQGEFVPYYSRQEIDSQKILNGNGYELAWLRDPWERYLLHVQGSGQIRLPDGKMIRVGFAGSNGRPYRSITRYLVERGFLGPQESSLQKTKEFLFKHPERMKETLNANERYIFFRLLREIQGPIGALGFPLTAGRSVAVDLSVFPPGALAYLVSTQPVMDEHGRIQTTKPIRRFALIQDTGAAMKGPGRVDLFCGSGAEAGMVAGEMREEGKIYFLFPKLGFEYSK
jgi:membrane-bound lytic murein transglycosylase A